MVAATAKMNLPELARLLKASGNTNRAPADKRIPNNLNAYDYLSAVTMAALNIVFG
jgi:hypothetical protein